MGMAFLYGNKKELTQMHDSLMRVANTLLQEWFVEGNSPSDTNLLRWVCSHRGGYGDRRVRRCAEVETVLSTPTTE